MPALIHSCTIEIAANLTFITQELAKEYLAVAVAAALFGTTSPAALAITVGVLTEVPVMLTLVKIAWFMV